MEGGLQRSIATDLAAALPGGERTNVLLRLGREAEVDDIAQAATWYETALDEAPYDREALQALARIYESRRQWRPLLAVLSRQLLAERAPPLRGLIHFKIGSLYEAVFRARPLAERHYRVAARYGTLPAFLGLRDLYRERNDWARVVQTLLDELELWHDPKERAAIHVYLGDIYRDWLGSQARAAFHWRRALNEYPQSAKAQERLADNA